MVRLLASGRSLLPLAALVSLLVVPAVGHSAVVTRGSVGEAYVTGARAGAKLKLERAGRTVATGRADRFGSKIFYELRPGSGYRVTGGGSKARPFRVLGKGANPKSSFYRGITLKEGLNYVKVRDGVELAMTVRLPAGKKLTDGPFPTVIEYSGYQVAAPGNLLDSVASQIGGGGGGSDPLVPASSTAVGSLIAPLLGFATVSVQMRGSGCSGGAFDLFGLPTTYDGYDAVETVAAQRWVREKKVGMVGISFSGITQLFTAGTRPPHLAAITPMSVTDDTYTATGYPGGIFNKGFALSWIEERMQDARPAPEGGQPWARALVKAGDKRCRDNQRLRLQTRNAVQLSRENPYRTPSLYDERAAAAWIGKIKAPVFLVGQYQDEQTGGHFVESLSELKGNPDVWLSLQNGVHADSLGPSTITEWVEFLKIFVAGEVPDIPASIRGLSGELYRYLADAPALPVQQSRMAGLANVGEAKAAFQRYPRVRLLMDNGAAIPGSPGAIGAAWEIGHGSWPIAETSPTTVYLGAGGTLTGEVPAAGSAEYTADPSARPNQTLPGSGAEDAWKAQPPYDWAPIAPGKGLGFTGPVLERDVVIAGPSSMDLWVKSTAKDTDFQVTLSEVRPDGQETYVQNGWLRASHRKLYPKRSTVLNPVPTHLKQDAAPLPAGEFTLVRVPVFPVAHAFRAGSRIRVTVEATGGDRPRWDFATIDDGKAVNTVWLGGTQPSKLVLPVIAGDTAKGTPLPPAGALRGQPGRAHVPASNGG
ncbi:MAG: CocE/NonD family hydrolase [Solirubrobacterales bacterium]